MSVAAVAAGCRESTEAAVEVLTSGGNAIDAAIAAGLTSAIGEPALTSLGGGGFMLVQQPDGRATFWDFFVDVPGLNRAAVPNGDSVREVEVRFPSTTQLFRVGPGTVATPGVLWGFLEAHQAMGRLPLSRVVAPAIDCAKTELVLEADQRAITGVLSDFFAPLNPNPDYAAFLERLAGDTESAVREFVAALTSIAGIQVTAADLANAAPAVRSPLIKQFESARLLTNPPPAFGGAIVADVLEMVAHGKPLLESVVSATEHHKGAGQVSTGTTHVSVIDGDGMVVSMTTSNGSTSGVYVPGTGIVLNNMLGESDVHEFGPLGGVPGQRLSSMMAPSVLNLSDGTTVAFGSGGSERIRTALSTVAVGLVERGLSLNDAILAPRAHVDPEGVVQHEPGWQPEPGDADRPCNAWDAPNFYFGGVNAVLRYPDGRMEACGDPRRGGSSAVVSL